MQEILSGHMMLDEWEPLERSERISIVARNRALVLGWRPLDQ